MNAAQAGGESVFEGGCGEQLKGDGASCCVNVVLNQDTTPRSSRALSSMELPPAWPRGGWEGSEWGSSLCHCDPLFLCVLPPSKDRWNTKGSVGKLRQPQVLQCPRQGEAGATQIQGPRGECTAWPEMSENTSPGVILLHFKTQDPVTCEAWRRKTHQSI